MTRSSRVAATAAVALALGALGAAPARAQGSLSTQGFGYPPGELSTRAAAAGGALGEFDPLTPLNPASLADWGAAALFFSYAPEFRTVDAPGGTDRTTTLRFPLLAAGLPVSSTVTLGVSASTLLDRSWATTSSGTQVVGTDTVASTERFSTRGAINDIRVGAGWLARPWLRVGIAGHLLTGQNRLTVGRQFSGAGFDSLAEASSISYSGGALSAGIELRPGKALAVAASGRIGGNLRADAGDTTLSSASAPSRFGAAVRFDGVPGATLAAGVSWDGWSKMQSLGVCGSTAASLQCTDSASAASRFQAADAWTESVGAEVAGPRFGGATMMLRAGARHRTLPFTLGGTKVGETTFAFGTGIPVAHDRARIDAAFEHASRSDGGSVTEHAWIVNIGLLIRP